MTAGKNLVVGVCGGIAAYKAAELVSALTQQNYNIDVIMTEAAQKLVAPLTFRTLSNNPVRCAMFGEHEGERVEHIALADKADLLVVAPATANILGKVAAGIADDLLSTVIMAAACPVCFFPAMNVRMWENPITQRNIATLRALGYDVIEPASGHLACGTEGKGRMLPVAEIKALIEEKMEQKREHDLEGLTVLISAGPTSEMIDPVRLITNRSSGKMGYALAAAAVARGARVELVSGATNLTPPAGAHFWSVFSAREMEQKLNELYDSADIVIMAAAVADYRVAEENPQKIKKTGDELVLRLKRNPDILAGLGQRKQRQYLAGFAAETEHLLEYAAQKLKAKNLDMIIANDVSRRDIGFDADRNAVTVLTAAGGSTMYEEKKAVLAHLLLDDIRKDMEGSKQ